MRKPLLLLVGLIALVLIIGVLQFTAESKLSVQTQLQSDTITVQQGVEEVVIPIKTLNIQTSNIKSTGESLNVSVNVTNKRTEDSVTKNYKYNIPSDGSVKTNQAIKIESFSESDFPANKVTELQVNIRANHTDVEKDIVTNKVSIVRNIDNTSCETILNDDPDADSGKYVIEPQSIFGSVDVYCDMDTAGGGWTRFW